jgi:hypothetical protein
MATRSYTACSLPLLRLLPSLGYAVSGSPIGSLAQEDYGIQNAPMKDVNAVLEQRYGRKPRPNILPATPADSQRIDTAIEERMLAAMKPKSQEEVQSPLSGAAERDFLANATTDEMKSYFEKKYPGGAR